MPAANPAVSAARTDEAVPDWQKKLTRAERKLHLALVVLPPMLKKNGSTSTWGGTKIPMAKTKLQAENYARVIESYGKPTSPPPRLASMRQTTGGSDIWYDKTGPRERKLKTKAEREAREKARAEERKRIDALNRSRLGRMFKAMPENIEIAAKVRVR